jgi:multidrug efflux pump subunit AcrA (membrane-fusion protein)
MAYKRWIVICLISTVVLVGCTSSASPTLTITPVITAPPTTTGSGFRPAGGVVVASGVVVPARFARMGYASPVTIETIEVELGDAVEAGDVLIRFQGQAARDAAVASNELAVLNAQKALKDLYENADVVAAQAQLDLANAKDDLHTAEYTWTVRQEGNRASDAALDAARAKLEMAEDFLDFAKAEFDANPDNPALLLEYASAQQNYNSELRNWNWYTGHPTEIQQAQLDAEVASAEARVAQAERVYEKVKDGPDPDVLAAANAKLKLAEAQLKSAQEAVQNGFLSAPFDGIVAELSANPSEVVVPGQILVVVADLKYLRVETTDLSERDVNRVSVGLPAEVFIEPLGVTASAHVTRIASSASMIGGDVVYAVTLDLDEQPIGLLWGMSVEAEIEVE